TEPSPTDAAIPVSAPSSAAATQWSEYHVIRRNGSVVSFEPSKIAVAMTKAFLAVQGGQGAASARIREIVETLTQQVAGSLQRNRMGGGTFHIEEIQDQVELALMRSGEHDVARAYVLYREKRAQERAAARTAAAPQKAETSLNVTEDGVQRPLDRELLLKTITEAAAGHGDAIDVEAILEETIRNLYDGVPVDEVYKSAILAARARVEIDPSYSQV